MNPVHAIRQIGELYPKLFKLFGEFREHVKTLTQPGQFEGVTFIGPDTGAWFDVEFAGRRIRLSYVLRRSAGKKGFIEAWRFEPFSTTELDRVVADVEFDEFGETRLEVSPHEGAFVTTPHGAATVLATLIVEDQIKPR